MKTTELIAHLLAAGFTPARWDSKETRQLEKPTATGRLKVCIDHEGEPADCYAAFSLIAYTGTECIEWETSMQNGTPTKVVLAAINAALEA